MVVNGIPMILVFQYGVYRLLVGYIFKFQPGIGNMENNMRIIKVCDKGKTRQHGKNIFKRKLLLLTNGSTSNFIG